MTRDDFVEEWAKELANVLFRGYFCDDHTPAGRYMKMDTEFKLIGQRLRAMLAAYDAFCESARERSKALENHRP